MIEYLAKYTVSAYMCDGGSWMPDPESHKVEYCFQAKEEDEAIKIARKHMSTFRKEFFYPSSTLDKLLKIEEVKL